MPMSSQRLTATRGRVGETSPNWAKSSRPPTIRLITAPTPRMPKPATWSSSTARTTASRMKATPAQLNGRLPRARKASNSAIPPTTPGTIRPGLNSSMTMPSAPTVSRMAETLGSEMNSRNCSAGFLLLVRSWRSRVSRVRGPAGVSTTLPCNWASRSSWSLAMKSTTFSSTASVAVKEAALRTVSSSFSWLRPRVWAMLRIRAAASLVTLLAMVSSSFWPPDATGVAAPMLVPGAITAKWAAAVIKVPAEPARAPGGETYTATGTRAVSSSSTIFRVELSSPPGVSRWIITRAAWSSSAWRRVRAINRSFTGLMIPSTVMTSPWGVGDLANTGPARPRAAVSSDRTRKVVPKKLLGDMAPGVEPLCSNLAWSPALLPSWPTTSALSIGGISPELGL